MLLLWYMIICISVCVCYHAMCMNVSNRTYHNVGFFNTSQTKYLPVSSSILEAQKRQSLLFTTWPACLLAPHHMVSHMNILVHTCISLQCSGAKQCCVPMAIEAVWVVESYLTCLCLLDPTLNRDWFCILKHQHQHLVQHQFCIAGVSSLVSESLTA